eukprot:scaffold107950_cov20-Tisochrysis_lutea.AAC.1
MHQAVVQCIPLDLASQPPCTVSHRRHPASQPPGGSMAPLWTLPGAHATASGCGVTSISMAHQGHLIVSGGEAGEAGALCPLFLQTLDTIHKSPIVPPLPKIMIKNSIDSISCSCCTKPSFSYGAIQVRIWDTATREMVQQFKQILLVKGHERGTVVAHQSDKAKSEVMSM